MKKNLVKNAVAGSVIFVLFGIGYLGGYWASKWWDNWKKENMRVIRCRHERPEIYDRSGILLIGNYIRIRPQQRLRYAAVHGKFAAGLLGFTEFSNGVETGRSGIEKMIDRKQVPGNPVYVSIDCGIQRDLEGWMERLDAIGKYHYMYAVCLNSHGELTGAAQRPVLDINNRQQVEGGTCFFPSVFLLPVPEEFMKLLGGSGEASPEEKAKFRFHHKLGVLSPEARGWVRGPGTQKEGTVAQAATSFNYLLAYISAAEKKTMSPLQVFSSGKQPPVVMKKKIDWMAVTQVEQKIIALGKAPELNGDWLYFLVCIEPQKQESFSKMISEIKSF